MTVDGLTNHRLQTARPYSVERDPEQAVYRKKSGPTSSLATKNVQLVTEGEVIQFQNRPTAESASKNRDNRAPVLMHAGDTTADHRKTLDFSALSEFLVATTGNGQVYGKQRGKDW